MLFRPHCRAAQVLLLATAGIFHTPLALPQANQQAQGADRPSTLVVNVKTPDGSPLDAPAVVNLSTFSGSPASLGVFHSGTAEFANLSPANYTLEVIAAGYQRLTQNVQILSWGERQQLSISLSPEPGPSAASPAPRSPVLAPNVQGEVAKALDNLRADKPEAARRHLEKAARAAPSHPDVAYMWGMYYAQVKDIANARLYWERALQLAPHHSYSLDALAQLALQRSDYATAVDYLRRAAEAAPSSWRYQERLAETYFGLKQYQQAQQHAQRALSLGKERAARAQLLLGQIFLQRSDPQAGLNALEAFVASQPSGPRAVEARKLVDTLEKSGSAQSTTAINASFPSKKQASPFTTPTAELMPAPRWMPPDVDDNMPPVESTAGCPMGMIEREAGKRVRNFVDAVNRIAATELVDNERIDHAGHPSGHTSRSFSYVASLQQTRPGFYSMEEYRNGTTDLDQFPERIATLGLSALVMVFHPAYVDNYDLICEGVSRWHGGLAWQVHFRQKADMPANLRTYRVNNVSYPIALRGRAWISTDTFEIENLETDLVSPVPKIQLRAEHISVEYAPVKFLSHHAELWLPASADLYFDYGHHRMHRTHQFRNYMLFAVDEQQQISLPNAAPDVATAPGPHQN